MIDYDNMPDWVGDNIEELAQEFIEWLEDEKADLSYHHHGEDLSQQKKAALELWEKYTHDRFTDSIVDLGDMLYDAWRDEQAERELDRRRGLP